MDIQLFLQSKYGNIKSHLNCPLRSKEFFSPKYENIIFLGDFNACMGDFPMIGFCETHKLRNLVKHPTFFKNPKNSSCMDLLLTNKSLRFQTTNVVETGLSDFPKMVVAIMKMNVPKMKRRVITIQFQLIVPPRLHLLIFRFFVGCPLSYLDPPLVNFPDFV